MPRNYHGKMKPSAQITNNIKTKRKAISEIKKMNKLILKHKYIIEKESEFIKQYESRIRILEEKFGNLDPN
jgi:hypothetical protein